MIEQLSKRAAHPVATAHSSRLALIGVSLLTLLVGCSHVGERLSMTDEMRSRWAMCDDMESALKPRFKVGGFIDTGVGGGGAIFDFSRPKVAAEHVRSLRAMVFECQLWARGTPGHDADYLSNAILRLSGVYVASPDSAEREIRLKAIESALASLLRADIANAKEVRPLTDAQRVDLLQRATALANDPVAMAAAIAASREASLARSPGTLRSEIWEGYANAQQDSEDLQRLSALFDGSEKNAAALSARVQALEKLRESDDAARTVVTFASGSAVLDNAARLQLKTLSDRHPGALIRVIGYADARGSAARNLALSQARASAVADALTSAGLTVVESVGVGPTSLFAGGLASNRRVTIEPVVLSK